MDGLILCRCGHTNQRDKHPENGPCGAFGCDCDELVDVWYGKPVARGLTLPSTGVREYDGETWIGLTHTAKLAMG